MPQIKLAMEIDTLFCRMGQTRIGMDKGGFGLRAEKVNDSLWLPKGIIGFRHLVLRVPEFALPIHMEKTSVTVRGPANHTAECFDESGAFGYNSNRGYTRFVWRDEKEKNTESNLGALFS